jgi:hypothetical protein
MLSFLTFTKKNQTKQINDEPEKEKSAIINVVTLSILMDQQTAATLEKKREEKENHPYHPNSSPLL